MTIRRISFRRDGKRPFSPATRSLSADIEVLMSETQQAPANMSTTFASNHGPNPVTVFRRKTVRFPVVPWRTQQRVQPDFYSLLFDRQFALGTGNVCWDARVYQAAMLDVAFDAIEQPAAGAQVAGFTTAVGAGCGPRFGGWPALTAAGNLLYMVLRGIPAQGSSPTAVAYRIGTSDRMTGSGVPLPLQLDAFGAPGCTLWGSGEVHLPMVRPATQVWWEYPGNNAPYRYAPFRIHAGTPLFFQTVNLEPNANNALGIGLSGCTRVDVPIVAGLYPNVQRVVATSSFGTPPDQLRSGALPRNQQFAGLVVEFASQ